MSKSSFVTLNSSCIKFGTPAGTRTQVFGFGDRHTSRCTTEMNHCTIETMSDVYTFDTKNNWVRREIIYGNPDTAESLELLSLCQQCQLAVATRSVFGITCTFPTPNVPIVGAVVLCNAFQVLPPASAVPVLSVVPNQGSKNATTSVTITSNVGLSATVSIQSSDPHLTFSSIVLVDSNHVTANFTWSGQAKIGDQAAVTVTANGVICMPFGFNATN